MYHIGVQGGHVAKAPPYGPSGTPPGCWPAQHEASRKTHKCVSNQSWAQKCQTWTCQMDAGAGPELCDLGFVT